MTSAIESTRTTDTAGMRQGTKAALHPAEPAQRDCPKAAREPTGSPARLSDSSSKRSHMYTEETVGSSDRCDHSSPVAMNKFIAWRRHRRRWCRLSQRRHVQAHVPTSATSRPLARHQRGLRRRGRRRRRQR